MNNSTLGVAVTVAFVVSFVAIVIWAYWPSNKAKLQALAQIPLNEDNTPLAENSDPEEFKNV